VAGQWPLTGRDEELAAMQAAVDDPDGGGIVLVGAQGVGRTRLAREIERRLAAAGRRTAWVTGTRSAAAVDLGALASLLPDDLAPLAAERPIEVLRRAGAVVAALGGDDRPVLVVDDAHLLDGPSAAFVHHVALHRLATLVVTVRNDGPPPDAVTALWKDALLTRCDVGPLSRAATAGLLERVLGGHLDLLSLRRIQRTAVGNPLFLREIVRAALDGCSLTRRRGLWQWDGALSIDDRLVELVEARLAGADPRCRSVLELVAWGEPLPAWLAEHLAGPDALEAAERAGLLERRAAGERHRTRGSARSAGSAGRIGSAGSAGRDDEVLRFVHPVHEAVLRATTTVGRRRAVCEQLAGALYERSGGRSGAAVETGDAVEAGDGGVGPDLLRIAVWLLEAGTPTGRRLVSFAAAARRALEEGDPDLAERLARAALDPEGTEGEATAALGVLSDALDKQGRHDELARLPASPVPPSPGSGPIGPDADVLVGGRVTRAAAAATTTRTTTTTTTTTRPTRTTRATTRATRAATTAATGSPGGDAAAGAGPGVGVAAAAAAGGGLSGVDPADDTSGGEVPATDAWVLFFDSRLAESIGLAQVVLARSDATPQAHVWAATAGTSALGLSGRTAEALAIADVGQGAARMLAVQRPWSSPEVEWARVLALIVAGRLEEARGLVEPGGDGPDPADLADPADRVAGEPSLTGMWRGFRGFVARVQGDHTTARASLREAVARLDRADLDHFVRLWLAELAASLACSGDPDTARRVFDEAVERDTGTNRVFEPWIALDGAWVCAGEGRLSEAVDVALRAADMAVTLGHRAFEVVAAFDVARLGRPELVEERLAGLVPLVEGRFAPTCRDAALALVRRDPDRLTDGSRRFEALGHDLIAAEMAAAALAVLPAEPVPAARGAAAERVRRLRARCPEAVTPLLLGADDARGPRQYRRGTGAARGTWRIDR
jgi:tetratricopeptide (TPR) repeat protein